MRIAIIGANSVSVMAVKELQKSGHDVILIDKDEERLKELGEELDCGLMHGDGSRPSVLEDLSPENTDILICNTPDDQDNIIASLVARSLEFDRVVTKIEDPEFEQVCSELGLQDVICPDLEVAKNLSDVIAGRGTNISRMLKAGLRVLSLTADEDAAGPLEALELPNDTRVIAVVRDEEPTIVTGGDFEIERDDLVLVLAREDDIDALQKRFKVSR